MNMTQDEYFRILIEIYKEKDLTKKRELADKYIDQYSHDENGFVDELINMRNGINDRINGII